MTATFKIVHNIQTQHNHTVLGLPHRSVCFSFSFLFSLPTLYINALHTVDTSTSVPSMVLLANAIVSMLGPYGREYELEAAKCSFIFRMS